MPQDRAGERGRVDNWDEEDATPVQVAPVAHSRVAGSLAGGPAPPRSAAPQAAISWCEMIRGTPLWIWLIGLVAAGGICMMFMTVMLIIGFGR